MPSVAQVKPKPDEVPSTKPTSGSPGPDRTAPEGGDFTNSTPDGENTTTLNDVQSLKKGIVKTSKNTATRPYTILLVGETGVGKSSVLELIANVLIGNDVDHYDFNMLEHTNEQGGSGNQSQTNSACVYELTSKNGTVVRILDTPGFTDTRSPQQDALHKESIATQIKEHIDSVAAVLVLVNGTVPGVTVGTSHVLSTLSAILPPNTLANNTAVVLTNVSNPLYRNFAQNIVPDTLKHAPLFLLNNPIALQKKYLGLKDGPNVKKGRSDWRNAVTDAEQDALEMLVELFDWLDGLQPRPQPTTEVPQNIQTNNSVAFTLAARGARVLSSLRMPREPVAGG